MFCPTIVVFLATSGDEDDGSNGVMGIGQMLDICTAERKEVNKARQELHCIVSNQIVLFFGSIVSASLVNIQVATQ